MFERLASSSTSYKGPLTRSKKNNQEEVQSVPNFQLVQDSLFLSDSLEEMEHYEESYPLPCLLAGFFPFLMVMVS